VLHPTRPPAGPGDPAHSPSAPRFPAARARCPSGRPHTPGVRPLPPRPVQSALLGPSGSGAARLGRVDQPAESFLGGKRRGGAGAGGGGRKSGRGRGEEGAAVAPPQEAAGEASCRGRPQATNTNDNIAISY
jgi:translation initiation factor IF-2